MICFENVSLRYDWQDPGLSLNTARLHVEPSGALGRLRRFASAIGLSTSKGQTPYGLDQSLSTAPASSPEILSQISFEVARNSFHFITGASGAGKTSLLRLIYLGLQPSSGQIYIADQPVSVLDETARAFMRQRIGVVFQDYRLLDHLTLYENVALPLHLAQGFGPENHQDLVDLLTWVGLGDKLQAYPQSLSGGQQQRVALARAVMTRPKILLADEPTGNLDDALGLRLIRLFEELNRIGTTVLIATHSRELLETFAYPQLHLEMGRLETRASIQSGFEPNHVAPPQPGEVPHD